MNASEIIDSIGGTGRVAVICGLGKSAISQWRKRGIPASWARYLKKIRPQAFKVGGK